MYDLFGKYGSIRQIRMYPLAGLSFSDVFCSRGTNKDTRGTAYVVFDDIFDAKSACEHLSGFNLLGRYLIVLYWQPNKLASRKSAERTRKELDLLKAQYNL